MKTKEYLKFAAGTLLFMAFLIAIALLYAAWPLWTLCLAGCLLLIIMFSVA